MPYNFIIFVLRAQSKGTSEVVSCTASFTVYVSWLLSDQASLKNQCFHKKSKVVEYTAL